MALDDCKIPKGPPGMVWTHVWIAETLKQARENRIAAQVGPNIPNTIYLTDEEKSMESLLGMNIRFCDVHGWPKNQKLEKALLGHLWSRGCTRCKMKKPPTHDEIAERLLETMKQHRENWEKAQTIEDMASMFDRLNYALDQLVLDIKVPR